MSRLTAGILDIAQKYAQKTAIAYKESCYTFGSMLQLAERMAARLMQLPPEYPAVAVVANRDADTAVCFLSCLLSGRYYVPLDPSAPAAKLQFILEEAQPAAIIGCEENRAALGTLQEQIPFLTLADAADEPCPLPDVPDDAPLYMVYTSGSTGKPKGVLKNHRSVVSFINAYQQRFGFDEREIIGNQTPFFFDASAKDLYLMLLTGATLEVLPTELFSFPVRLVEYLNQRCVTFLSWVPSALCIVTQLNTFKEILPETVRRVFFVGEVFPIKQLGKWMAALPHVQYVNLYGSSEIAGVCCCHEVQADDLEKTVLPIGTALDNCDVFLLKDDQRVTTQGELGEICVSGDALAIGYFHDAEKTASRFVEYEGKRIFKTGDLAWYDEHGRLNFAARTDFQIKHMGHRIELGEIEAIADEIDEIIRCCCLYDGKRIVLFCELAADCGWDGNKVKSALRERLSSYMVPGRVVVMEKLPVNANGKLDRQMLKEKL